MAAIGFGTIVTVEGDVKILSLAKTPPFLKFNGNKFSYKKARVGQKVKSDQFINTGPDGKAKVIYPSGDHFTVGPGSSIKMPKAEIGKKKKSPTMEILFGKVRSLVSKNGDLKSLKVKTSSAVAGVRGTDFFVSSNPSKGTQISVLRGKVEVSMMESLSHPKGPTKDNVSASNTIVAAGYTAHVKAIATASGPSNKNKSEPIDVDVLSREKLIQVQTSTQIKTSPSETSNLSDEIKQEVKVLQEKSRQAVVEDIKIEDPDLYKQIIKQPTENVDEISTQVVSKFYHNAPAENHEIKPSKEEVDQLGKDIYEKYFKK